VRHKAATLTMTLYNATSRKLLLCWALDSECRTIFSQCWADLYYSVVILKIASMKATKQSAARTRVNVFFHPGSVRPCAAGIRSRGQLINDLLSMQTSPASIVLFSFKLYVGVVELSTRKNK
jgi:hypothetical protein